MAPQNAGTPSVPMNIAEMMVAIGRIEEKVNPVEQLVTRITSLEIEVEKLKESRPEKVKFVTIVTAIAASVAIVLGFANLQVIQQNRTQQAVQLEMLQKNQDQLIAKVKP